MGDVRTLHGDGRRMGSNWEVCHHCRDWCASNGKRVPHLDVQRTLAVQANARTILPILVAPEREEFTFKAQEADIKKNLKKYSKKSEEEDERVKSQQATMLDKAKQETKEKWEAGWAEKKRKIDSDEYQGVLKKILGVDYAKKEAEIVTIEEEEEEIISRGRRAALTKRKTIGTNII